MEAVRVRDAAGFLYEARHKECISRQRPIVYLTLATLVTGCAVPPQQGALTPRGGAIGNASRAYRAKATSRPKGS